MRPSAKNAVARVTRACTKRASSSGAFEGAGRLGRGAAEGEGDRGARRERDGRVRRVEGGAVVLALLGREDIRYGRELVLLGALPGARDDLLEGLRARHEGPRARL